MCRSILHSRSRCGQRVCTATVVPSSTASVHALLVQAEQRQAKFEKSAVGRAAYTSVKDAKRPSQGPTGGNDNARDWMS